MSRPSFHAAGPRFLALCAFIALPACSAQEAADASGDDAGISADPPGAAVPLSIGNGAPDETGDAFAAAVNCAAALDLTAERLAQMTTGVASREIELMERAGDFFIAEAERLGADKVTTPAASLARRKQDEAGATRQQAQLAIACLRRYGEEVG